MELPERVRTALAMDLGSAPALVRPVRGGDIARSFAVELADGRRLFCKHMPDAPADQLQTEADGLAWLRVPGGPGVPAVRSVGPAHLALDWIEAAPSGDAAAFGRALAAVHASGAPAFGWHRPGYLATIALDNRAAPDWPTFYGERRLRPLLRCAVDQGRLGPATIGRLESVIGALPNRVGPPEPPARLHGDLWSGNRLFGPSGRSWLVDPSPFGGHREVDLAMMELFGGFPPETVAALNEVAPLEPDWRARIALYQLLPLLVHVVLFGGGYAVQLDAAARCYA